MPVTGMADSTFQRHPIAWYLVTTGIINLLGYGTWFLSNYGYVPTEISFIFILIGGLSPFLAALILTLLQYGSKGPAFLFSGINRTVQPKLWFVLVLPFLFAFSSVLSYSLMGNHYDYSAIQWMIVAPVLISSLLMNTWEEIGWRGYLQPQLQDKYSILFSSFVVGIIWAVWHWALMLAPNSAMLVNYGNIVFFIIETILLSIIYGYLYQATNGNWFIAALLHAGINTANMILFSEAGLVGNQIIPFYMSIIGMVACVTVFLAYTQRTNLKKRKITFTQIISDYESKLKKKTD